MKDSSQLRKQFDKLKEAFENAQKRKKKAKSAYKSQMKAFKSQMKPFRLSYKQAQLAEHEAKVEYKALLKELKKYEDDGREMTAATPPPATKQTPAGRGGRGRKPRQTAPVAVEKTAGRQGRKRVAESAQTGGGDDLTKVVGVGAKVAAALQKNGIFTYEDMAATSLERYKLILREAGMGKFRNPTTWANQAAELAGVEVTASQPAPSAQKELKRRGRQPGSQKAAVAQPGRGASEKLVGQGRGRRRAVETAPRGGGDDLTKVLGVGDKVAEALRANGIRTFATMAETPLARYKEILKENGMSKFRNPTTWAKQAAGLAGVEAIQEQATPAAPPKEKGRRGRQPGFKPTPKAKTTAAISTTESEPGKKRRGRQPGFKPAPKVKTAATVTSTAAEGETVKRRPGRQPGFKPGPKAKSSTGRAETIAAQPRKLPGGVQMDDLTKIKGIGDRVQTALNEFGIYSYQDVARTSLDRFKEILKARGMSKFRDPSGWAQGAAELTGK